MDQLPKLLKLKDSNMHMSHTDNVLIMEKLKNPKRKPVQLFILFRN